MDIIIIGASSPQKELHHHLSCSTITGRNADQQALPPKPIQLLAPTTITTPNPPRTQHHQHQNPYLQPTPIPSPTTLCRRSGGSSCGSGESKPTILTHMMMMIKNGQSESEPLRSEPEEARRMVKEEKVEENEEEEKAEEKDDPNSKNEEIQNGPNDEKRSRRRIKRSCRRNHNDNNNNNNNRSLTGASSSSTSSSPSPSSSSSAPLQLLQLLQPWLLFLLLLSTTAGQSGVSAQKSHQTQVDSSHCSYTLVINEFDLSRCPSMQADAFQPQGAGREEEEEASQDLKQLPSSYSSPSSSSSSHRRHQDDDLYDRGDASSRKQKEEDGDDDTPDGGDASRPRVLKAASSSSSSSSSYDAAAGGGGRRRNHLGGGGGGGSWMGRNVGGGGGASLDNGRDVGVLKSQVRDLEERLLREMVVSRQLNSTLRRHDSALGRAEQQLAHYQANFTQLYRALVFVQRQLKRQRKVNKSLNQKLSNVMLDVVEVNSVLTRVPTSPRDGVKAMAKTFEVHSVSKVRSCPGVTDQSPTYLDCWAVFQAGHRQSGVYYVRPRAAACPVPVWCDMDTPPGGWLVFQRRQDGSVNFNRQWDDYRDGFGTVTGEHWLGNDNLFLLTNQAHYQLRVDLWDFSGNRVHAVYSTFRLAGERDRFKLTVTGYTGSAQDSLYRHNGMAFSTPDRDNDGRRESHCAAEWEAGWWFNDCWFALLNGAYHNQSHVQYRGIAWNHWKRQQLRKTEMKMRPVTSSGKKP